MSWPAGRDTPITRLPWVQCHHPLCPVHSRIPIQCSDRPWCGGPPSKCPEQVNPQEEHENCHQTGRLSIRVLVGMDFACASRQRWGHRHSKWSRCCWTITLRGQPASRRALLSQQAPGGHGSCQQPARVLLSYSGPVALLLSAPKCETHHCSWVTAHKEPESQDDVAPLPTWAGTQGCCQGIPSLMGSGPARAKAPYPEQVQGYGSQTAEGPGHYPRERHTGVLQRMAGLPGIGGKGRGRSRLGKALLSM